MGEAKWQPAQCWNERRVNLIDKHRWRLNLTTLRSYLTICCSLLRSPSSSASTCLALTLSPPLLLSLFLPFFLPRDRIETMHSCLQDPRCKIAATGRMKFRMLNDGARAGEGNWKREPSGTGIEPISGAGRLEVYHRRESARVRNISCASSLRTSLRVYAETSRSCASRRIIPASVARKREGGGGDRTATLQIEPPGAAREASDAPDAVRGTLYTCVEIDP